MTPEGLRVYFRFGVWITVLSIFLILAVPKESAEFVVSVCSFAVGLTLLGMITLVSRAMRH